MRPRTSCQVGFIHHTFPYRGKNCNTQKPTPVALPVDKLQKRLATQKSNAFMYAPFSPKFSVLASDYTGIQNMATNVATSNNFALPRVYGFGIRLLAAYFRSTYNSRLPAGCPKGSGLKTLAKCSTRAHRDQPNALRTSCREG